MKPCKSKALASLPKWKDLLERTNGGEGLLDIVAMAVAIAAGDENVYQDLKERILKQGHKDPDTVPALLARLEAVADMRQSIKAQANFTGTDIYTEMAGKIADAVAKEHSLDFSLKSLEKVDSLLHGAKQRTEKEKKRLAESLGYYVGEVLIRETGGQWCAEDPSADSIKPTSLVVEIAADAGSITAKPLVRCRKRIENGKADGVAVWAGVVVATQKGAI